MKKFNKFVKENIDLDNLEFDDEELDPNQQQQYDNRYVGGGYKGDNRTKENVISHWKDKWNGTCLEDFPDRFLEAFPTPNDYHEWEKDLYDYEDEDDEYDFNPEDEVYNIMREFGIVIGDMYRQKSDCHMTEIDWVDFYNDMWSWK